MNRLCFQQPEAIQSETLIDEGQPLLPEPKTLHYVVDERMPDELGKLKEELNGAVRSDAGKEKPAESVMSCAVCLMHLLRLLTCFYSAGSLVNPNSDRELLRFKLAEAK